MITTITIILIIVVNNAISTVLITCLRFVEDKESSEVCSVRSYNYHRKAGPHLAEMSLITMIISMSLIRKISMLMIISLSMMMVMMVVVQTMPRTLAEKDLGVPSPEVKPS